MVMWQAHDHFRAPVALDLTWVSVPLQRHAIVLAILSRPALNASGCKGSTCCAEWSTIDCHKKSKWLREAWPMQSQEPNHPVFPRRAMTCQVPSTNWIFLESASVFQAETIITVNKRGASSTLACLWSTWGIHYPFCIIDAKSIQNHVCTSSKQAKQVLSGFWTCIGQAKCDHIAAKPQKYVQHGRTLLLSDFVGCVLGD